MPWVSPASKHKWYTYAVKLDENLRDQFEAYKASIDDPNITQSGLLRILIAAGLHTVWGDDQMMLSTVMANAKAGAISRLTVLLEEAFELFRDPEFEVHEIQQAQNARYEKIKAQQRAEKEGSGDE